MGSKPVFPVLCGWDMMRIQLLNTLQPGWRLTRFPTGISFNRAEALKHWQRYHLPLMKCFCKVMRASSGFSPIGTVKRCQLSPAQGLWRVCYQQRFKEWEDRACDHTERKGAPLCDGKPMAG